MFRLFLSIAPPIEATRSLLACAGPAIAAHPDTWRITAEHQVHLTLHFLGTVDPRRLDHVTESVDRSAAGLRSFTLTADRLACLPERGPPRVLAAVTDTPPDMLEIQRRAFHRLASREQRTRGNRFTPHITLARTSTVDATRLPDAAIDPVRFDISEIHLVRSDLRPTGPVHTAIHTVGLAPARAPRA